VTFNSYGEGFPPPESYGSVGGTTMADTAVGCTHPGALGGGPAVLSGAFLPTTARQPTFEIPLDFGTEIDTYFAVYRDFFAGECTAADNGQPYMKITAEPGVADVRDNPVPFDFAGLSPDVLGLHILDYSFMTEDLRELLEAKIAAR
jgi:hypothetical protein